MSNKRKLKVAHPITKVEKGRCPECGSVHLSALIIEGLSRVRCRKCEAVFTMAQMR